MIFDTHIFAEHYFEMSKIDAKEALTLYRHFCKQTERVVEYLGVAKKLQNLLNVPIPNLRHVRDLLGNLSMLLTYTLGPGVFGRISGRIP